LCNKRCDFVSYVLIYARGRHDHVSLQDVFGEMATGGVGSYYLVGEVKNIDIVMAMTRQGLGPQFRESVLRRQEIHRRATDAGLSENETVGLTSVRATSYPLLIE
jgi:hypothetical protein